MVFSCYFLMILNIPKFCWIISFPSTLFIWTSIDLLI